MATMRAYEPDDSEALAKVYRKAARVLGRQAYSEEATRVWALYPEDMEDFHATLAEGLILCAVSDGFPIAFGQLYPDDHISFLYCHPAHARRGHDWVANSNFARKNRQLAADLAPAGSLPYPV